MIVFIEPSQRGESHAPFTSAFLQIFAHCFPEKKIRICAHQSHLDVALNDLEAGLLRRVDKFSIDSHLTHSRFFLLRCLYAINFIKKINKETEIENPKFIFLTGEPLQIWAAKIYSLFNWKFKCHLVLHGDVTSIQNKRSKNPLLKIIDYTGSLSLFNSKRVRFIALEQHIRKNIEKIVPSSVGFIDVIEHPCLPMDNKWNCGVENKQKIRLGLLGIAGRSKGLDVFSRVAIRVQSKLKNSNLPNIDFRLVGKLHPDSVDCDLSGISGPLPFSKVWLPKEIYENEIKELSYIVLPYSNEYYGLSASGVLLDVLRWRKPIIYYKTPAVNAIIEAHGGIGYVCNNEDDMVDVILSLCSDRSFDRYKKQQQNINNAYLDRLPDSLARRYANILADF